jgi:hypothetical protein
MTDAKIVPLQEPTIRRGNHGEAFSQDVKDAAFSLYVVVCNDDP